jgi:hypothetical protein
MAELEPRLQQVEDRISRDHTDDVAIRDYRHLRDILTLHPFQKAQSRFLG